MVGGEGISRPARQDEAPPKKVYANRERRHARRAVSGHVMADVAQERPTRYPSRAPSYRARRRPLRACNGPPMRPRASPSSSKGTGSYGQSRGTQTT